MPKLIQTDKATGHITHTDLPDGEYSRDDINQRTQTRAEQMAQAIVKQAQQEGWNSPDAKASMNQVPKA